MPAHYVDLTGQTFDRLRVISRAENSKNGRIQWNCLCACGNTCIRLAMVLKRPKNIHSCGCFMTEHFSQVITKHGQRHLQEYVLYHGIRARCSNPKHRAWGAYGGRGIKICQRWMVFQAFYHDMGPRPSPKHSIDRIDNNGHYSCGTCEECLTNGWPMNCRWATAQVQALNTRRNKPVFYEGQWIHRKDLAALLGIKYFTLCGRITRGMSLDQITTPSLLPNHPSH